MTSIANCEIIENAKYSACYRSFANFHELEEFETSIF